MSDSLKLKICGMRNPENIKALLEVGVDFIGFIFFKKSTRYVDDARLSEIAENIDYQSVVKRVGVFVDADIEMILRKNSILKLDFIQLHGQESPVLCQALRDKGFQVIKVFSVGQAFDFDELKEYESVCDFFLFDTKGKLPGGNGFQFDWSILAAYDGSVPFFLGGGIGPKSVQKIHRFNHSMLYAIDGNSGFEISPAQKDVAKIRQFKTELSNLINK